MKNIIKTIFETSEERTFRKSTAYLEFQYCELMENIPIEKILDKIDHWKDSSLYVYIDNFDLFFDEYKKIFDCAAQQNGSGTFDMYGINYYNKSLIPQIINSIQASKSVDYEILITWLKKGFQLYNGFYILGV